MPKTLLRMHLISKNKKNNCVTGDSKSSNKVVTVISKELSKLHLYYQIEINFPKLIKTFHNNNNPLDLDFIEKVHILIRWVPNRKRSPHGPGIRSSSEKRET